MTNFAQRRNKLRALIRKEGTDGLLVTNFINVTYLTGFTGDDSFLLVTPKNDIVISDERYTTQLEEECPELGFEIRGPGKQMLPTVAEVLKKGKFKKISVEAASMTLGVHAGLTKAAPT